MLFSYALPARRFYRSSVIDDHGRRYAADRTLAENVLALADDEWGPAAATRAAHLAQLVVADDPAAGAAPLARRWAAAILCTVAGSDAPTRTLIEGRTGVSPAEVEARLPELTALLSARSDPEDDGACARLAR